MREVSNSEDILDVRDIDERIEELEDERADLVDAIAEDQASVDDAEDSEEVEDIQDAVKEHEADLDAWDDEYAEELRILRALKAELDGCEDPTLIRDSYFEDYAQELAEDLGLIPKDNPWPCYCIDWERAASELQTDYSSVEFDGVTYWVRQ